MTETTECQSLTKRGHPCRAQATGHTKPETTARYTAVPGGALRRAVDATTI